MPAAAPPPLPDAAALATLGKRACPECGGDLQWNAAKQALACPYCGTVVAWTPASDAVPTALAEHALAQALATAGEGARGYGDARREVQCQSCRAISALADSTVADRCPFCGSPSVVPHEALKDPITPQAVLPFKLSDTQVRESIRRWYGTRWFAPNRLKTAALTDTLHGVYLPYWTFDAQAHAQWSAEAGYHYYETETYRENGQTRTRQVQRTRWEPASGALEHFFDDTLVPGTEGVHARLLAEIEPFPTSTDLAPYAAEYVRGWTVERYQVDLRQAAELNISDLDVQLRELCAQQVPGDTYRNLQVNRDYTARTFKHVLVPVWLVSYTYGRRSFQVLANGYTGALAGERPYSAIKIALAVIAAVIVATVFFWLQGQN